MNSFKRIIAIGVPTLSLILAGCTSFSRKTEVNQSSPSRSLPFSTPVRAETPATDFAVIRTSESIPLTMGESESKSSEPLSLEATVQYALQNNPQLAALRKQHGTAEAGVVIAKTYPFNPVYQGTVLYAKGAGPGAVTNPVLNQHQITLELQIFQQQRYRQEAAFAGLTRTDWEIATQELTFAVNAIRAFDGLIYRQAKLAVNEEFLRLNQKSVEQVKQLVDRGTLKSGDLILARAEVNDIQAQVGLNRTAYVTAIRDFYRALGVSEGVVSATGTLERPVPPGKIDEFLAAAKELRPDRFARAFAIQEAEATLRLQKADRFGNPQFGPAYEYNESRSSFIGAKIQFPIPILNRRPGEILQAEARRVQAAFSLRQIEVEIVQEVNLALARVDEAEKWVENYRRDIIPALKKALEDMESLFQQGQAGVDVLRVLDVRRKLLRAQDGYLDALLVYTSALADLAQAVGDPALAMTQTPINTLPEPQRGATK